MDIKQKLNKLPLSPGVYIMKDRFGNVIYIGKAKRLKSRVSQYFSTSNKVSKVRSMVSQVADFDYILTNTEIDALMLENNLIKKYQPFYNILLKDDKSYPYIKVTLNEEFPRLEVVRKVKKDGAKYFGPYFGVISSDIIKAVNYAYPIRTCKKKIKSSNLARKACLNYSLGLCSAPCIGKITKEEYMKLIPKVCDFLSGKDDSVFDIICDKMNKATQSENFEVAIKLRDLKLMLLKLKNRAITALPNTSNIDVFGMAKSDFFYVFTVLIVRQGRMMGVRYFSFENSEIDEGQMLLSFLTQYYFVCKLPPDKILLPIKLDVKDALFKALDDMHGKKVEVSFMCKGINAKLIRQANDNAEEYLHKSCELETRRRSKKLEILKEIKEKLKLKNLPLRIEAFDVSNTFGTSSVCSMVVFLNGMRAPKHYRKFKVKTVSGINDFESLKECITRRLKHLKDEDMSFSCTPSLVLIDGGKGQVSSCLKVIKSYDKDVDVIGLAEKNEEIFVGSSLTPIKLSRDDEALKLLERVRDEAHRFAISFHRRLRRKAQIESILDDIPGLGEIKKQNLIKKFKSVKKMKKAVASKLMEVSGITSALARKIIEKLNSSK